MTREWWLRWLAIGAIAAVALFLRLDALGEPVTWYDESITALRSTGHTEKEVVDFVGSKGVIPISDLHRFMQPDPAKGLGDTLQSLIREDAQHTPAYYVLAHYWTKWTGPEPYNTRLLAVFFSMLSLPAFYWLCRELFVRTGAFESEWICWIGVFVLALSPFHVAFAREHREYSMWMFAMILTSAAFFRALRLDTRASWIAFSAALILASYTHLLSWAFWAVLAITILVRERSLLTTRVRAFALASIAAGVLFLPWAWIVIQNRSAIQQDLAWAKTLASPTHFHFYTSLFPAFRVADLSFLDLYTSVEVEPQKRFTTLAVMAFPILVAAAVYFFGRRLNGYVVAFFAALLMVISLPAFVSDFVTGGVLGAVWRYAAPTVLGWELILTFLFGCLISSGVRWKSLSFAIVGIALAVSGYSAYWEHSTQSSFQKRPTDFGYVADYLNNVIGSTIATDDYVGALLSLSTQTPPNLLLLARPRCPSCPDSRPAVEIPDAGSTGKLLFYRSWMNFGNASIQKPMHQALSSGTFEDPRYRTSGIQAPGAEYYLYELTPK